MKFDTTNWRVEKIKSLEEASIVAEELKQQGMKIVTVNGSFDLLHAGHLDQLEEARKQGDVLFVGVNSDVSVREGKNRPFDVAQGKPYITEEARAAMLAALACVDYVVIVYASYDEVAQTFIRAIQPHVHVNGPDYGAPETWIEWPAMQEVGASGYTVQKRNDLSTSELIEKIKQG